MLEHFGRGWRLRVLHVGCLSWVERIDSLFSSVNKTVSHSMHIIGKQMNLCLVWTGPKIFLLFSVMDYF